MKHPVDGLKGDNVCSRNFAVANSIVLIAEVDVRREEDQVDLDHI